MRVCKTIKKIPWPEYNGLSEAAFQATSRLFDEDGDRLLILTFAFNPKRKKNAGSSAAQSFRMILSKTRRDYAVLFKDKPRTTRSPLAAAGNIYPASCYADIDPLTENLIKKCTGGRRTLNHQLDNLQAWNLEIIAEHREAARAASGRIEDEAVDTCPTTLPAGMIDWIENVVMPADSTLIYKPGGKRGVCALCHATIRMPIGKKMRQSELINCPECGQEVRCVLSKSALWKADYVDNVLAVQRGPDGTVWFRMWHIRRDDDAQYEDGVEKWLDEVARYAIRDLKVAMWLKEYKASSQGRAPVYQLKRWTRCEKIYTYDGTYSIYTGGLEEATAGTILAYADLPGYIRANLPNKNVLKYAQDFARYPVMEFLWKAGYHRIVDEKVRGIDKRYANDILWQQKILSKCIRFPLKMLKQKPPGLWRMADMHRMRAVCEQKNLNSQEQALLFHMDIRVDELKSMSRYATASKTLRYLERQCEPNEARPQAVHISDLARVYRDYLSECETLHLDLSQPEVLFPPHLEAAHMRTSQMVTFERDSSFAKKFNKQLDKLMKLTWENGGLLIRPASGQDELIAEGKELNHCVGGYAQRMAGGQTAIFLIRRTDAPNTPYYTLELQDKNVVQCRTLNNKPYDGEVEAFIEAWKKQVVDTGGKKPERVRVKTAI